MVELQLEDKGFTLLETIMVLAIVSVMGFILVANIVPIYNKKVLDTFIDQLEKDIMYTQQYAQINEISTHIVIKPTERKYTVGVNEIVAPLFERTYNSDIYIEASHFSNRIIYNPNGSIRKSGTIYFTYQTQTYKVVFYLGKGRFKIQKL